LIEEGILDLDLPYSQPWSNVGKIQWYFINSVEKPIVCLQAPSDSDSNYPMKNPGVATNSKTGQKKFKEKVRLYSIEHQDTKVLKVLQFHSGASTKKYL
jgi:hypothetical protein